PMPAHNSIDIARRYKGGESGTWMPLGLALTGVVVFVLGILQVGKSNITFTEFNAAPAPSPALFAVAAPLPQQPVIVAEQPKAAKRFVKKVSPRRRRTGSRGKLFLTQANRAFKRGEYPKAYVLAGRSLEHGGGGAARHLHEKAKRLMGLKE
ncbi:hypothetical protein KKF84_01925, partial [Myxococcota bacterium]|nr:hypothetical protein [Myxococcota bacterium]